MDEEQARALHALEGVRLIERKEGPDVSHHTEDGVYIKQLFFPEAGVFMGQHAHTHSHALMVASGELRLWIDGEERGDYKESECIHVEAGKKHTFMSLCRTVSYCIHNLHGLPEVEIQERAEFPG